MGVQITDFDVSEYLNDEESIANYLSEIIKEGDVKLLLSAISDIAKARGMSKIASDSGLGRESLYKALNSEAKPRFDTILRVLNSLGLQIGINAIDNKSRAAKRSTSSRSRTLKSVKRKTPLSRPGSTALKSAGQKRKA